VLIVFDLVLRSREIVFGSITPGVKAHAFRRLKTCDLARTRVAGDLA